MSAWCCPADGTALDPLEDGWRCRSCETTYPATGNVVQFDRAGRESSPVIAELRALIDEIPVDAAAAAFCTRYGCRRVRNGADWKLLLPVDSAARVLEVGPGFGDVTLDLASRAKGVTVLVADRLAGEVVQALAHERRAPNVAVASVDTLAHLPFGAAQFDAIACVEAGLQGFGVAAGDLGRLASELRRVAAPGATVLVGHSNPLHRLPGVAALRDRLSHRAEPTLDRVVHVALGRAQPRSGGTGLLRAMANAGFAAPRVYAPIPDEQHAKAVVPVADKAVVRYFLDNLVRQNAPLTRAALAAIRPLVAVGLFPRLVPYSYHVFTVPENA